MNNEKMETQIPRLKITDIKLRNLYYRTGKAKIKDHDESPEMLQGSIRYWFSDKKKSSFKTRSVQEIKYKETLFRARHETRFTSNVPIAKELFDDNDFQSTVINMLLPFGSELFASLTGKSFVVPIIAPSELPESEESDI